MTTTTTTPETPTLSFDALPLTEDVRRAIDESGWTEPTEVQVESFQPAIDGRDLLVQARTGTGKTAAFGLPLVDRLVNLDGGAQALVLAPTRELALQSAREIGRLGNFRGLKTSAVYGGAPIERQIKELADGAQIVSGTPGRVLDHLRRGTLNADGIRILVLDEADEMLSMGFAKELHAIIDLLPKERQTMLYSATVDGPIQRMAERHMKDPLTLELSGDAVGALGITHYAYHVSGMGKTRDLVKIMEAEDPESAIIFCNTKAKTEEVARGLKNAGYNADWLNGDLAQREREKVMKRTREGSLRYLVATDVAARGIDVSHVTHVINYDLPQNIEQYIHRTGRTGRAGRTGTAIALVAAQDLSALYFIRLTYKIFPIERTLPSGVEEETRREADRVELLSSAFAAEPNAEHLAVARRLLTHASAERILGGLIGTFFAGQTTEDVDDAAATHRRTRRVSSPEVEVPAQEATRKKRKKRSAKKREAVAAVALPEELPGAGTAAPDTLAPVEESPEPSADPEQTAAEKLPTPFPSENAAPLKEANVAANEEDGDWAMLYVSLGRKDGARAGTINRLFQDDGGLERDEIGRIRIRDKHSFVQVPRVKADALVEKLNGQTHLEKELVVEPARGR